MPDTFEPSDPKNLLAIRTLSWNIIRDVAPDEELSAQKFTDRIVKAWEEGKLIPARADATNTGGLGNIDLVLLVVIPVVIAVLEELGRRLETSNLDALKQWVKEKEANKNEALKIIDLAVERDYKAINEKVKSKKARSKERTAKQAIKVHLKKLLELLS